MNRLIVSCVVLGMVACTFALPADNVTPQTNQTSNASELNDLGFHVEKTEEGQEVFFSPPYLLKKKNDEYCVVVFGKHGMPAKLTLDKNGEAAKFLQQNSEILKKMNAYLNEVSKSNKHKSDN